MIDVDGFSDEQKKFLAMIVSDLGGPTMTSSLLYLIERVVYGLKPDFDLDAQALDDDLRADIEVCFAAANYAKIKQLSE